MTRLLTNNVNFLQPTALFRELIMLDEIGRNESITQSVLAERAGIVPAMANNYVKTFAKKEYITIEGNNNRDMKYFLTDIGEEYKMSLLLSYFQETVGLYKNVRDEIKSKLDELLKEGIKTVVLYGAAETGEITLNAAELAGLTVIGIVDADKEKHGNEFAGRIIDAPEKINEIKPDAVIISSSGYQDIIYETIKQHEQNGIKVRKL